ncbi:unnamed protein product [Danaus chrysippus]|uniref:(African queen) hypothetical protein n=1 Tax=Danaus chrysippus TaxID=151541 RepID=A0A8J2RA07_9NEOP|nr:unnamed protein product [Danaus chrysippus]
MLGREVRTSLHAMFLRGEHRPPLVKHQPHLIKEFNPGDRIQARDYTVGSTQRWRFGTIQERLGRLHYKIITDDGCVWRRHIDHIQKLGRRNCSVSPLY